MAAPASKGQAPGSGVSAEGGSNDEGHKAEDHTHPSRIAKGGEAVCDALP